MYVCETLNITPKMGFNEDGIKKVKEQWPYYMERTFQPWMDTAICKLRAALENRLSKEYQKRVLMDEEAELDDLADKATFVFVSFVMNDKPADEVLNSLDDALQKHMRCFFVRNASGDIEAMFHIDSINFIWVKNSKCDKIRINAVAWHLEEADLRLFDE